MNGIGIGIGLNSGIGGVSKLNGNPSALILTVLSDTSIKCDWTNGATNQDGTYIYTSLDGVTNWTLSGTALGALTTKTLTGLTTNTLYYIKVVHYKGSKLSNYSNIDFAGISSIVVPNSISTITNSQVHPSIVYFPNSWNGFKYWLAITPFPGDPEELPCLYVSNDLTTWTLPSGASNPLFGLIAANLPRDPHLFYDAANDRLIYYIGTNAGTTGNWYSYTSDGVNWSALTHITIDGSNASGVGHGSQCVIKEGVNYIMWDVSPNEVLNVNPVLKKYTSTDGFAFTTVSDCTFDIPYAVWHFEVYKENNLYYMLACTTHASNKGGVELYLFVSSDGIDWNATTSYPILDQYKSNPRYYKCTTFKENGKFTLITNEWDGDYDNEFKLNLYRNIELPFSLKPPINLSLVPTLPYIVGDNFERADSATSLGTSTSGHVWTNLLRNIGISYNRAYAVHATTGCYATVDCGVSDNIIIEGRFNTTPLPATNQQGILFRVQDSTHYFVFSTNASTSNPFAGFILRKQDAAVETTVLTIAANRFKDGDIVGVKLVGNDFTFYRNGAVVGTYTDSSFNTATKHGLKLINASSNTLNGFCNYFSIRNI